MTPLRMWRSRGVETRHASAREWTQRGRWLCGHDTRVGTALTTSALRRWGVASRIAPELSVDRGRSRASERIHSPKILDTYTLCAKVLSKSSGRPIPAARAGHRARFLATLHARWRLLLTYLLTARPACRGRDERRAVVPRGRSRKVLACEGTIERNRMYIMIFGVAHALQS